MPREWRRSRVACYRPHMDLSDSPEHAAFRKEVRAWLKTNVPAWRKDRSGDSLEYDDPKRITRAKEWQRKLYAAGYVAMGWPREYGGQGADVMKQTIVKKLPSYKWVVEDLCPKCEQTAAGAAVPASTPLPKPPVEGAKLKYEVASGRVTDE